MDLKRFIPTKKEWDHMIILTVLTIFSIIYLVYSISMINGIDFITYIISAYLVLIVSLPFLITIILLIPYTMLSGYLIVVENVFITLVPVLSILNIRFYAYYFHRMNERKNSMAQSIGFILLQLIPAIFLGIIYSQLGLF